MSGSIDCQMAFSCSQQREKVKLHWQTWNLVSKNFTEVRKSQLQILERCGNSDFLVGVEKYSVTSQTW